MHSSALPLVALLACLAHLVAAIDVTLVTPTDSAWVAGKPNTFTWTYSATTNEAVPVGTTATLVLMKQNGNPNNMTPLVTLATGVDPTKGSITAALPAGLVNAGDYALQWQWTGQPSTTWKYTGVVAVTGGAATTSGSTTSTSTTSTSSTSTTSTTSSTTTSSSSSSSTSSTSKTTSTSTTTVTPKPTTVVPTASVTNAASHLHAVEGIAAGVAAAVLALV
ncbi:hypothetical protein BC828DRAFT_390927 [Blastocladiella britannica]|nr:hypothetical protein BC828DRAFT_390927 [Blastocladiella britannica]